MQACVKAPLVDRLMSSCLPTGGVKFSYLLTGGVMSVSPDWRSLVLAPPDQLDSVIVGNDTLASTAQISTCMTRRRESVVGEVRPEFERVTLMEGALMDGALVGETLMGSALVGDTLANHTGGQCAACS